METAAIKKPLSGTTTDVDTGEDKSVLVAVAVVLIKFTSEKTSTTDVPIVFVLVKTTLPLVPVGTNAPQSSQHVLAKTAGLAMRDAETPPMVTVDRFVVDTIVAIATTKYRL